MPAGLKRELGVTPSAETEALHQEIKEGPHRKTRERDVSSAPTAGAQVFDEIAAEKPTLAVLPFANLSGDKEQRYFSDGITADLITQLSRFHGLLLKAGSTASQYRDKPVDVRRVGHELGVQYLVEGSVRRIGTQVRITVQLVEATGGNHLWAERYDRTLVNIFELQDEVVAKIASRLEGRVATKVAEQARRKPTENMAAYECVLRAREHLNTFDWLAADPLLRQAIKLDPDYAQAHAWLARNIVFRFFFDLRNESLDEALDHARRATSLDESDGLCHSALAITYLFKKKFELSGVHYERALALNPADIWALSGRCRWLSSMGRHEEALGGLDEVLSREPFPPSWYWESRSVPLFAARRWADTIDAIGRMSRLFYYSHVYLAACHAQLGQLEQARAAVEEVLRLKPDFTITRYMECEPFSNSADTEAEVQVLRDAGLPD
jgi:TolB-like protein